MNPEDHKALISALNQVQEILSQIDIDAIDDAIERITEAPQVHNLVEFDEILSALTYAGYTAMIANVGSDVAVIYVAPWVRNDAGDQVPSWFIGPGYFSDVDHRAYAWDEELSLKDSLGLGFTVNYDWESDESPLQFGDRCVEFLNEQHDEFVRAAGLNGFHPYNGIG